MIGGALRRVVGESWAKARVDGELSSATGSAPVKLTLERYPSGPGFQISRAEDGAFVRHRQ